jgi:hypothetical protein
MTMKAKATKTANRAKADTSAQPSASPPATPKGWRLETARDGRTRDQFMAQAAADGILGNARSLVSFSEAIFGELSLTDCAKVLKGTAQCLNDGDLSATVTMLAGQAVALNAMFGELARVGQANMFKAPDYADRYLRLAFKAQAQSRATLETLAAIKNPPVMFARQANINNGGQQQVNNGTASPAQTERPFARAGGIASEPNRLLEANDGERLDAGAQGAAGTTHQDLAPVGTLDRTEKR